MRWLACPLLGLAACSPEVVEIPLPLEPGTQAAILGVVSAGHRTLTAIDPASPPDALPGLEPFDRDAQLFLLRYERPLSALGLQAGGLLHDPNGEPPPAPRSTLERAVRPGAPGTWREVEALSADLEFRLPDRGRFAGCPALSVEVIESPVRFRVMAAVVDELGVFGLSLDGRALRIDERGVREVPGDWPEQITGATRTATGAVWLGDGGGLVYVGTPQAGFRLHSRRPHGGIRYLVASDADAPEPELYTLSRTGVLERRAGGTWVSLDLGGREHGSDRLGDLLWLGPGEVAAVAPQSDRLSIVRGDQIRYADVDIVRHGNLSSIALLNGTLYGATGLGDVLRFGDREYTTVFRFEALESSYDIIPFANGILFPGGFLDMRMFVPGEPPCPSTGAMPLDHVVWTAVRWKDRIVAFTSPNDVWDDTDQVRVLVIQATPQE